MGPATTQLQSPPWLNNHLGEARQVGVEIEMTGLSLDQLAELVQQQLGGQLTSKGRYERQLEDTHGQAWVVELDFHLLKQLGREERPSATLTGELGKTAEEALAWLAENLVPLELVSPPLSLERLTQVEDLIQALHQAGAKGSSDRWVNAFGLQLNPEIPSAQPEMLVRFLQAFLCLYDWLHERARIDLSRQVTSYINPFPPRYVKHVLAADYRPDLAHLIDDYLADNPTRNRALDCLPLFKHLDPERVARTTDDPLIKARPTFHYRLPSSELQDPHWGLHSAWNDWIEVERLAADPERLNACCQAYLAYLNKPLDRLLGKWSTQVEQQWLGRS